MVVFHAEATCHIKNKAPAISPLNYGTNTKILTKKNKNKNKTQNIVSNNLSPYINPRARCCSPCL